MSKSEHENLESSVKSSVLAALSPKIATFEKNDSCNYDGAIAAVRAIESGIETAEQAFALQHFSIAFPPSRDESARWNRKPRESDIDYSIIAALNAIAAALEGPNASRAATAQKWIDMI